MSTTYYDSIAKRGGKPKGNELKDRWCSATRRGSRTCEAYLCTVNPAGELFNDVIGAARPLEGRKRNHVVVASHSHVYTPEDEERRRDH